MGRSRGGLRPVRAPDQRFGQPQGRGRWETRGRGVRRVRDRDRADGRGRAFVPGRGGAPQGLEETKRALLQLLCNYDTSMLDRGRPRILEPGVRRGRVAAAARVLRPLRRRRAGAGGRDGGGHGAQQGAVDEGAEGQRRAHGGQDEGAAGHRAPWRGQRCRVAITDAFRRRFDRYVESACGGARETYEGGRPGADPSRGRSRRSRGRARGRPPRATSAERIGAANDFCLLP